MANTCSAETRKPTFSSAQRLVPPQDPKPQLLGVISSLKRCNTDWYPFGSPQKRNRHGVAMIFGQTTCGHAQAKIRRTGNHRSAIPCTRLQYTFQANRALSLSLSISHSLALSPSLSPSLTSLRFCIYVYANVYIYIYVYMSIFLLSRSCCLAGSDSQSQCEARRGSWAYRWMWWDLDRCKVYIQEQVSGGSCSYFFVHTHTTLASEGHQIMFLWSCGKQARTLKTVPLPSSPDKHEA